jgi:phage terminase large subunit-like protein
LQGLEKDEENVKKEIRKLYDRYNISIVNVESNNGGEIIARQLRNNNIAVQILNSTKDKVTRLREHEGEFTRGDIFFIK